MSSIPHTDLILNRDGSIYHLHLLPEDISDTIILVGDPGRVRQVSAHFEEVEMEKMNREFLTHTGIYKGKRISVLSTGIGTDNIDIVLNELDAIVNVDLKTRSVKNERKGLKLIRIGTCGALHSDIVPGSCIVSKISGGFDGVYHFYNDERGITVPGLTDAFKSFTAWKSSLADPYFIQCSDRLFDLFSSSGFLWGITLSTPGFYAPQVRSIRLTPFDALLIHKLSSFSFKGMRINNFEMESSALYALSELLGHQAITICVAIANRISTEFLDDYKPVVDQLITSVLDKLVQYD